MACEFTSQLLLYRLFAWSWFSVSTDISPLKKSPGQEKDKRRANGATRVIVERSHWHIRSRSADGGKVRKQGEKEQPRLAVNPERNGDARGRG